MIDMCGWWCWGAVYGGRGTPEVSDGFTLGGGGVNGLVANKRILPRPWKVKGTPLSNDVSIFGPHLGIEEGPTLLQLAIFNHCQYVSGSLKHPF